MADAGSDVQVVDNTEAQRFEVIVDGEVAGYTQYEPVGAAYRFPHTEIDSRFEGHGLGSKLIGGALDAMRQRGISVLPVCPFVRSYIQRHREYADLVPAAKWADYDLDEPDAGAAT
jgi:predicted GNAT family acetyltransferase